MTTSAELKAAIAALEAQRALLGDAVVDTALAPLRGRLAALGGEDGPREALRLVSVLFLDVVGSTAISRELDPEDVRAVFHSALRRFGEVVARYEGSVLRYIGDGMMALFGGERVREDDAERAVRCGLALIDEARALAPKLQAAHGVAEFSVRVGISTGPVLLSQGVDGGYDVSGITVSVAARMEQTAPASALRISHHTFAHVRGLFDVAEQPPIPVKGLEQPILTYLVREAKRRDLAATARALASSGAALVGRENELARLQAAFAEVASTGQPKVLLLCGDAGMGKSRLLLAFSAWLKDEAAPNATLYGHAHTYGVGVPHGLVRDLFFARCGIADSDTLAEATRKLRDALAPAFGDRADEQVALVGELIGLDFSTSPHIAGIRGDPRQMRHRAFRAATEFLRFAGADRTLVLLFDDVHWADEGSLDFIRHLCAVERLATLCICAARPDFLVQGGSADMDLPTHERVDVAALPSKLSGELADALLRRVEDPPEALRDLVIEAAEGNRSTWKRSCVCSSTTRSSLRAKGRGAWLRSAWRGSGCRRRWPACCRRASTR